METLRPKLRFPEFNNLYNDILFKEVIESYGYGPRFNANDYCETGNVKTIRGTDISLEGEIKYIQVPTALLDDNTVKTHKLIDGDLVMITTADCGLTGVYRKQSIDFIPSAYAVRIRLNKNANSFYFKYFFQTKLAKIQVDKFIRKATVANLPGSDILRFNINLPNIEEQTRIANFLSSIDEKLNLLKEKKSLLEDYKKGIMQKIFKQEIRFKDDNGNDFEEWEEKKLGDYKELIHGDGNWILSKDLSLKGKYKLIQLGNVGFGNYVEKELKTISEDKFKEIKGTLLQKGDLLINRMVDNNLYCCILDKDGDYITSVDVCWIRENNLFNNYFLMSILLFNENQVKLLNLSSGSGRVRISKSNLFNEFKFLMPDFKEQTKIADFLSSIDKKIELVSTQIQDTQEYKRGVLQQMFI